MYVAIVSFVCDAPARSYITCVKGHTSYFGCSKCETKDEFFNPNVNHRMGGRVTYPQLDALLRTNDSFRNRLQSDHNTGDSILERLNIDMIHSVPIDPMHLTDLGVMRKLLVSWDRGKYMRVKLSATDKSRLSERIKQCWSFITDDFPRKLGPLELLDRWKSTALGFLN